jgi:hypothetical protein
LFLYKRLVYLHYGKSNGINNNGTASGGRDHGRRKSRHKRLERKHGRRPPKKRFVYFVPSNNFKQIAVKYFQLSTLLLFLVLLMYVGKVRKLKGKTLRLLNDYNHLDSLHVWKSERLKNYYLISIRQSEIIDRFQSSRRAKEQDTVLTQLQTKID